MFSAIRLHSYFCLCNLHLPRSLLALVDSEYPLVIAELGGSARFVQFLQQRSIKASTLLIHALSLVRGTMCETTSEESGTIGGRNIKEFADADLTMGKHPAIANCKNI